MVVVVEVVFWESVGAVSLDCVLAIGSKLFRVMLSSILLTRKPSAALLSLLRHKHKVPTQLHPNPPVSFTLFLNTSS